MRGAVPPACLSSATTALLSPLVSVMPRLPDTVLELAAYARPVLALILLIGVWPRATALMLASIGYGLMALDRYRYFHHLHLLWLSCGLLALCPSHAALSAHARAASQRMQPRWPLQLLRFQALIVYAAAGSAKLDSDWLSGRTLAALQRLDLIGGPLWLQARTALGEAALAGMVALLELALVGLLGVATGSPRWRHARARAAHGAGTRHVTLDIQPADVAVPAAVSALARARAERCRDALESGSVNLGEVLEHDGVLFQYAVASDAHSGLSYPSGAADSGDRPRRHCGPAGGA